MGGDAARNADQLTRALENTATAEQRVAERITETGQVSERDGVKVLRTMATLDQLVREVFGDISQAPEEFQKAFQKAHDGAEQTTQAVRTVNAQVRQQREELTQAGASWDGLGPAINRVLGPQGRVVAQGALVIAAFREGIDLGTRFAEAIGTNFQAAEDAAHGLKESIKGITNALVTDGLSAAIEHTQAALHNLGDTITGSGKAMEGYNALVHVGISRQDALKLSTQELAEIAHAYEAAQDGGAKALKLFAETAQKTDYTNLASQLTALTTKFKELSVEEAVAEAKERAHKEAIDGAIKSIEGEITRLESKREALRRGIPDMQAVIDEYAALEKAKDGDKLASELAANVIANHLTPAMREEIQHLQQLAPDYARNTDQVNRWVAALEEDYKKHHDQIDPEYQKQLESLIELTKNIGKSADATGFMVEQKARDAIATADNAAKTHTATGKLIELTGALGDHNVKISNTNEHLPVLNTMVEQLGHHLGRTKTGLQDTNEELGKVDVKSLHLARDGGGLSESGRQFQYLKDRVGELNSSLADTLDLMIQVDTQAAKTAESIRKLGDAGTQAAGGHGGGAPHGRRGASGEWDEDPQIQVPQG